MSDSPSTRPPAVEAEARRIAADMMESVRDDYEWRNKMAQSLSRIEANGQHTQMMMEAHAKLDDERLSNIRERLVMVTSVASSGEKLGLKMEGANNFIKFMGGLVVLIAAVGSAVIFVMTWGRHS